MEKRNTNTYKKWNSVQSALELARKNLEDGIIHITYNSIAFSSHTPYQYAWGGGFPKVDPIMNESLKVYLKKNSGKQRLGIIMVDFHNNQGKDNSISRSIIESNFYSNR